MVFIGAGALSMHLADRFRIPAIKFIVNKCIAMERIIRKIRRRTRVVGAFPDGQSALILVAARLRHVASTKWGIRKYLNMELLNYKDHREALADNHDGNRR
jgi:transposase-like protein